MRNMWKRINDGLLKLSIGLMTMPVFADLPVPPDDEKIDSGHSVIDIGGGMAYKTLRYACVILGVIIFVAAASGIIKAYHTAQEKHDMGHFFKWGIVGAGGAAFGMALVYAGYAIIPA